MANAFPVDAARRCIVFARPRLSRAGQHAHQVQAHFFRNLTLGHVQLDEFYTTLRNTASDLWVWVAFDPVTKLLPALQLGPRTQDVPYALLQALSQVLAPGCPEGTHVSVNGLWGKAAWHFGAEAMIGIPGFAFQQGFDKGSPVVESEQANLGWSSAVLHKRRKLGKTVDRR